MNSRGWFAVTLFVLAAIAMSIFSRDEWRDGVHWLARVTAEGSKVGACYTALANEWPAREHLARANSPAGR